MLDERSQARANNRSGVVDDGKQDRFGVEANAKAKVHASCLLILNPRISTELALTIPTFLPPRMGMPNKDLTVLRRRQHHRRE